MEFKKFKSSTGKTIRVARTSGHVYLFDNDWQRVPEFSWSDCYAAGCVSEDMFHNKAMSEAPEIVVKSLANVAKRKEQIRNVLQGWVENNEMEKFSNKGIPKVPEINKELPFGATRQEMLEVWYKLQDETTEENE